MAYVEITICQWCCDKERVLLDLYFSNRYEDERYDVMRKLVEIGGVRALGTIALSAKYEDERIFAMKGVGRIGGGAAADVLGEVAKQARYEDERQLARNLLVQC